MKQTKKYQQINQFERDRIEILINYGHLQKDVAQALKRDPATISREIKRNRRKVRTKHGVKNGKYESRVAQHKAYVKRKYAKWQGKKIEREDDLREFIIKNLKVGCSPDEISGRMKQQKKPFYSSKTAIYDWLYSIYGREYCQYLYCQRHRPKRRKTKKTKREMIPNRVSITERPLSIGLGLIPGHFEGDTVVSGKKTRSQTALAVITEMRFKYLCLEKINGLKPEMFNQAILKMKNVFTRVGSLTLDNGLENKRHEQLGIKTYFCDPYSPYQKPRVENRNKFIRRFIPKGSDIGQFSAKYIKMIADIWNNKPLKSLGYQTPTECMTEAGLLKQKEQPNTSLVVLKPQLVYATKNIYFNN
jgi:IS30 family transposase